MRILSQTNDIKGYHGTIGTPTNMYDYRGEQYVMGIASIYNSDNFKVLDGVELNTEEWGEKFDTIDSDFRVYKVKDHSQLAIGEKITFLSVVDVADYPTNKGGDNNAR